MLSDEELGKKTREILHASMNSSAKWQRIDLLTPCCEAPKVEAPEPEPETPEEPEEPEKPEKPAKPKAAAKPKKPR